MMRSEHGKRATRHARPLTVLLAIMLCGCAGTAPATPPAGSANRIAPVLAVAAQRLLAGAPVSDFAQGPVHANVHGRLQVYVYVDAITPEHTQALHDAGLENVEANAAMGVVQGWLLPGRLETIAALPFVTRVAPPRYARTR